MSKPNKTILRVLAPGRIEMQVVPSMLQWRSKVEKAAKGHVVELRVRSPLTMEFIKSYVYPYGFSENLPSDPTANLVDFPVENWQDPTPYWQRAELEFTAEHASFFSNTGFPETMLGKYLSHLHAARQIQTQGISQLFLMPYDPTEMHEAFVDEGLWSRLAKWCDEQRLAFFTNVQFLTPELTRPLAAYGMVDTKHRLYDIWELTVHLLHSRYYIGCDGFYAQMAYLLGVPAIILPHSQNLKSLCGLQSHMPWQHVRYLFNPCLEDIVNVRLEVERLLLSGF